MLALFWSFFFFSSSGHSFSLDMGSCFSALGAHVTYSGTSVLCLFYKNEKVVLWLGLLIASPKLKLTHTKKEKMIPLYFFPPCNSHVTAKTIWDLQFNNLENLHLCESRDSLLCIIVPMIIRIVLVIYS